MISLPYPKRIRYTHRLTLYKNINDIFNGPITSSITGLSYPTEDFKLALTSSGICRVKVTGLLDGVSVTERISFGEAGTQYSLNTFDTISTLTSNYFVAGTTLQVQAVDSVGMPLVWKQTFGPYGAEFGQQGGMSAQIQANELGLGSKIVHYCRVERAAPVSRDMTFTISPNYPDQVFVPVSDFENISVPPSYVPSEWAFRSVAKYVGE